MGFPCSISYHCSNMLRYENSAPRINNVPTSSSHCHRSLVRQPYVPIFHSFLYSLYPVIYSANNICDGQKRSNSKRRRLHEERRFHTDFSRLKIEEGPCSPALRYRRGTIGRPPGGAQCMNHMRAAIKANTSVHIK